MRAARALRGAAVATTLALAACGGGGDGASPPTSGPATTTAAPSTIAPGTTGPATTDAAPAPSDPGDAPGAVLASEAVDAGGLRARARFVTYRSTSLPGDPIEVTGLVVVPDGEPPPGGWPVLSWAHGTTGVADRCAPSRSGVGSIPLLDDHLAAGFVVAATDYEGLGTPGVHPYLVAGSEGRSVLDAARAARAVAAEVAGPGAAGDLVALAGHSQGGHAALAAASLASDWAPELDVVGAVAIAPAADVEVIVPFLFGSALGMSLGAYVAAGWPEAHPELDAADLLTDEGLALAAAAAGTDGGEGACVGAVLGLVGDRDVADLVGTAPGDRDDWTARAAENAIDPADLVAVPTLVAQGGADVVIPAPLTAAFVERACAAGVATTEVVVAGADHVSIVTAASAELHDWLRARVAGDGSGTAPSPACS